MTMDIRMRRTFRWLFIVADVRIAILGTDFLGHFNLNVSICESRFKDKVTLLAVVGLKSDLFSCGICIFNSISRFQKTLAEFPYITKYLDGAKDMGSLLLNKMAQESK